MSAKDWILLFVPIGFNGILLFIFQQWWKTKLDKITLRNVRTAKIIDGFIERIQHAQEVVVEIESQFCLRKDLKEVRQKLCDSISDLYQYEKRNEFLIELPDDLEKLRADHRYCDRRIGYYQTAYIERHKELPKDVEETILEYLAEMKEFLRELLKKAMRL